MQLIIRFVAFFDLWLSLVDRAGCMIWWDDEYGYDYSSRLRHQMNTFSAWLAICAGNSPVTGEFPAQRPVAPSFDVLFHLGLNEWLSKQSWGWWFETPLRPLWCHSNVWSSVWTGETNCSYEKTSKVRIWEENPPMWNSLKLVQVILVWQIPVCPDQWHSIKTNIIRMWCTSRIGTWSNSIHYLHAAFGWHNQEAWNAVSHVCGWLSIIHHFRGIWHQSDSFKYGNFDWWHPWLVLGKYAKTQWL